MMTEKSSSSSTITWLAAVLMLTLFAFPAQAQFSQATIALEAGPDASQISVLVSSAFPISFAVITLTSSATPSVSGGPAPGHISNASVVYSVSNVIPILANGALSVSTPDFSPIQGIGPEQSLLATIEFGSAEDTNATICIISAVVGVSSNPDIVDECAIVPGPSPSAQQEGDPSGPEMEAFNGTVRSDPHMRGLRGQEFDFTGEVGKIYALVSDQSLEINAYLGSAWVYAIHIQAGQTVQDSLLRPQGTWITALGLLIAGTRISVSVDEDEETAAVAEMLCPDRKMLTAQALDALSSCFLIGSVQVDDMPIFHTGTIEITEALTIRLRNSKSFGRVQVLHYISGDAGTDTNVDIDIDTVPPPPQWLVDPNSAAEYSYINLHIRRLTLTEEADGVLGQTSRISMDDVTGEPILKTSDANGAGVLKNAPGDFEVSDLWATDAVVNQYK